MTGRIVLPGAFTVCAVNSKPRSVSQIQVLPAEQTQSIIGAHDDIGAVSGAYELRAIPSVLSCSVHSESESESQSIVTKRTVSGVLVDGKQGGKDLASVKTTRPCKTFGSHDDEPRIHGRLPDHEAQLTRQLREQGELCARALFVCVLATALTSAAALRTGTATTLRCFGGGGSP